MSNDQVNGSPKAQYQIESVKHKMSKVLAKRYFVVNNDLKHKRELRQFVKEGYCCLHDLNDSHDKQGSFTIIAGRSNF